jgi:hypothetical protein
MIEAMCPVCGQHTFTEEFELCPVCDWQQDSVQEKRPEFGGGANKLSLNDYRARWLSRPSTLVLGVSDIETLTRSRANLVRLVVSLDDSDSSEDKQLATEALLGLDTVMYRMRESATT